MSQLSSLSGNYTLVSHKIKSCVGFGGGKRQWKGKTSEELKCVFILTSLKLHCTSSSFHSICTLDLTLLGENGQQFAHGQWLQRIAKLGILKKLWNTEKANDEIFHTKEHLSEPDSVLKITAFYHFKKIVITFSILEINSIEYILWVNSRFSKYFTSTVLQP